MKRVILLLSIAVSLSMAVGFCQDQPEAQSPGRVASADNAGNYYSATTLYNSATNNYYLHINRMDANGYITWQIDKDIGADLKAVSGVIDNKGNFIVLAERRMSGCRSFEIFRYSPDGALMLDKFYDDGQNNIPVAAAVDQDGSILVGGQALNNGSYAARLWKFDSFGGLRWMREKIYPGNTYAVSLNVDFNSSALLGLQNYQADDTLKGTYRKISLLYDPDGYEVRSR